MIPASLVPKNGDASTKTESTIAKIPTPLEMLVICARMLT
jgi:hypothetical protein